MVEAFLLVGIGALLWAIRVEVRRRAEHATIAALVQTFGPALVDVEREPRRLLAWHPLAEATRKLFPAAFSALDTATGSRFPFSKALVERAHATVSSEWLAWEKAHDEEYRIKAAAAEQQMTGAAGEAAALARARLDRIQHEKIERYQQRYEQYVRTAKALQALLE